MVVMVLVLVAARWAPEARPADLGAAATLSAIGWAAFVVGTGVFASGLWLLRRAAALSALPRPLETASMVATGPYRYVRHPVYAGLVLAALGVGLFRYSPWTVAAAVALFVILDVKRRREEAWLAERYADYSAYRARTRALIPFLY
jgi:protein-S-isoprenylcysteine O-methyltransferase Ste14